MTISTLQQNFRCKNVEIEISTLQQKFSNRYPGPRATSFFAGSAGTLEQMVFISAKFQKIQRRQSQQISATDLLGLHFLLEVLGCWNRWFLYQQIFSKLSKGRPSKFQQQVCWASSSIFCWKCWNAGTDGFYISKFAATSTGQSQQISATDLLGLELHHFLLEVVGCWNKYRWFLYKQIFRKFSTHCPAPSTYCQLICSLFLEGVKMRRMGLFTKKTLRDIVL